MSDNSVIDAIAICQIDYRTVLKQDEIDAIEHECLLYEDRAAAAIDALQIVQRQRRWISDESLYAIADLLQMPVAQLEGVATFYNLIYRQPVGEHVIHLCDSISCWLHDFPAIGEHLKQQLGIDFGQTTEDGKVTLLTNVCLGCCDTAPALMHNGELVENLTIESVDKLLVKISAKPEGES
ncbi:NADH-quinone oxidoreductase subunit NuoE [Neptunicella sp. SCSIO 80796]|uniref:NADH-quinone oxidoreductase subunit NuoE n=1 Tax=Neptunicella plasticusilytica TaxID=3117012 RepID=UPI003A4D7B0B